jgi:glycerol-3-phosphate dehydrogenase
MAEAALKKIESVLGQRGPAWTKGATLPGGDFSVDGFDSLLISLRALAPKISATTVRRLARAYGTEARAILSKGDLGRIFGADLGEREVDFLVQKEWARTTDDILWRRSKLGLRFTAEEAVGLARYLDAVIVAGSS